jgi:putative ABC transport system substrate-binding protein
MKRIIIITALAALAGLVIGNRLRRNQSHTTYTIGILQTASHPALDAVREGFIEEMQRSLGNEVTFITHNAQGSITQAHASAQQLHADKNIQAVLAIATPAAQAMQAVEQEKPIIIAAVTDPHALGFISPDTNICGTQDMIDIAKEVEMLVHLIPHAKTVGLLYTSGETNSLASADIMRAELKKHTIATIDFAIGNEADLHAIVDSACRKTDVILAPTDNTVASAISLIAKIAEQHAKPLIVSDNMLVPAGALASRGVDYKLAGTQAAQIAHQVLIDGKKPFEIPIERPTCKQIIINESVLKKLKLTMPQEIEHEVTLVAEGL